MPLNKQARTALITDYCKRFPDVPTKTLARQIYEQNKDSFKHVEQVRSGVRYRRGQLGCALRKQVLGSDLVQGAGDSRRATGSLSKTVLSTPARILIFDIETSPMLALPWGCFKQFINPEQLLAPQKVLCWAAKWLGEGGKVHFAKMDVPSRGPLPTEHRDVFVDILDSVAAFFQLNDHDVCRKLWDLFDEADIVVAHNGKAFDETHLNARWLEMGLPPPSPYKSVDTLMMARKFKFPRKKLESIGRYLHIGQKTEHEGFNLWVKCMRGQKAAWAKMRKYNIQDVRLLEEIYIEMRPWATRHPNVGLYAPDDLPRCVACGAAALEPLSQPTYTMVSEFESFRCGVCGKVQRSGRAAPRDNRPDTMRHSL